jgi:hypothetical protein
MKLIILESIDMFVINWSLFFMEYGGSSTTSSNTTRLDTRRVDPQVHQPQIKRTSAMMKVKLYIYFMIYVLLLVT